LKSQDLKSCIVSPIISLFYPDSRVARVTLTPGRTSKNRRFFDLEEWINYSPLFTSGYPLTWEQEGAE
jgi:hypothetical protein